MAGLFRPHQSFLTTNAWQKQAVNALRYNTSQVGSVVPMIYGTTRQAVNLIGFGGYRGPGGGKKGKGVGPLPIGGTSQSGKGGGGGKKGGKKTPDYSVDVMFGICEGQVSIGGSNNVWASAEVAAFGSLPLNLYVGSLGQAGDPTFAGLGQTVNYSGTCCISATPMDLGPSPVIPNLSVEVSGFHSGEIGVDANPANVYTHFLLDPWRGAGWLLENLDTDSIDNCTQYYNNALFGASVSLDGQQSGLDWLAGFVKLNNTTMVWSGNTLKFIPYGDVQTGTWFPNLMAQYVIDDESFLSDRKLESGPEVATDPLETTRINPVDAVNWVSIEYLDRANNYNSTILAQYDQSAIDQYGLRTGDNLQGKQFATQYFAQRAVQVYLQRLQYIRNTPYKFKLGWQYALLDPMDILLLTGNAGDDYLNRQAVRITSIEENDNGDLTIEAEQLEVPVGGTVLPARPAPVVKSIQTTTGRTAILWAYPKSETTPTFAPPASWDSAVGTFSVWIAPTTSGMWADSSVPGGTVGGLFTFGGTAVTEPSGSYKWAQAAFWYYGDGSMRLQFASVADATVDPVGNPYGYPLNLWHGYTAAGVLPLDGNWHHVYLRWNTQTLDANIIIDGTDIHWDVDLTISYVRSGASISFGMPNPFIVSWSTLGASDGACCFYKAPGPLDDNPSFVGGTTDYWLDRSVDLGATGFNLFRVPSGKAVRDLGPNGSVPRGGIPPDIFLQNQSGETDNANIVGFSGTLGFASDDKAQDNSNLWLPYPTDWHSATLFSSDPW